VVDITVPDEYYERYRRVAHAQLYRELQAGQPHHLDALADLWHSVAETLKVTAADMRTDLAGLQAAWVGEGSREYQYRLGLVAAWAEVLAGEAEAMRAGLAAMSGALVQTQQQAGAEPGDAALWAHDAELAAVLGLGVTDEDRTQSQERLARLVAELAVSYELSDSRSWSVVREPPPSDLPGRFVESDHDRGTQLAGVGGVGGRPAIDVVSSPGPATMLSGTGLASSATAVHLPTGGGPAASTVATAAALPPPVMGANPAHATGYPAEQTITGRRTSLDAASWSAEEEHWTSRGEPSDDPPPSVLGDVPPAE
jgi:hypothetical protein